MLQASKLAVGALATALVLAGCDGKQELQNVAPDESTGDVGATKVMSSTPIQIETRQLAPYGRYLTDGNGRALYMFMADNNNPPTVTCYDACVEDWPPLTTEHEVVPGPDINPSLVGTVERKEGGTQLTYAGWPLYFFQKDSSGNTAQGQDLMSHGAEWYLLSPEGNIIKENDGEPQPDSAGESQNVPHEAPEPSQTMLPEEEDHTKPRSTSETLTAPDQQ